MSGYKVLKVPPRSRKSIVVQASQLVRAHYPELWSTPAPVPVADFLERYLMRYHIDYGVVAALSTGEEGKIVGVGSEGRPEILIPEPIMLGLYGDVPRARFTTAHEVGHGILHGHHLRDV